MEGSINSHGSAVAVREHELIAVIRELVRELHPQRAKVVELSGSVRLERDLGIDSLGRTELILRIERAFRVRLPGTVVGEAETVSDPSVRWSRPILTVPRVRKRPQCRLFPSCRLPRRRGHWWKFWSGTRPSIRTAST